MTAVPAGTVRVCLGTGPGGGWHAEFLLTEADLLSRKLPDSDRRAGTVAFRAAETAYGLTYLSTDDALDLASEGLIPHEYAAQVMAFRSGHGQPARLGDCAEVTRASGARSLWRCTPIGWDLLERQPAGITTPAVTETTREAER